ncbi:ubiquitin carboxyl-terminal hydrolase [Anaeramoeba flamelloides]|uniref:Ubiquitin carboxyl-terminal hydrolase n=1 Tax=Anaeramoeba flamelloides TaxID=1746091 RepID=A0AAV7ZT66_9EUKA|nr:ubiquitin carboxyl-terminal hydrolase [Anaeramoeba flamelloides]
MKRLSLDTQTMPRIKTNNYALPNKKTGMHYQKQGSFSVPRPRPRQRQRSRFDTDIEDGVEVKVGNLPFPKIVSLTPTNRTKLSEEFPFKRRRNTNKMKSEKKKRFYSDLISKTNQKITKKSIQKKDKFLRINKNNIKTYSKKKKIIQSPPNRYSNNSLLFSQSPYFKQKIIFPSSYTTTTNKDLHSIFFPPSFSITKFSGIKNLGNTCYMNSILQLLIRLDIFVKDLMQFKSTELPPTSLYQNLLNVLEQSESGFKTIDISTMRKDIMKLQYFMRFQNYNQQDALEFLENIFNQLQFELFKYYKKTKNNIINLNNNNNDNGNQDNNSNKKKNKKNKNKKKTKTGNKDKDVVFSFKDFQNSCPISKNFDFLVSVNFICEGCGSKSQKVEIFRTLSLKFNKTTYGNFESNSNDVLKNKTKTQITPLNELLDSFFQDNEIITKKCSDCGANFAKRFLKIIKLPRFLLLHIQRVGIKKDKKPKEKKNKNSNKNCVLNNNNEIDVNSDGGGEAEEEEEHFSFFKIPNLVLFPDKLNLNEYCLPNYTKNCHTPLPNILSLKQTKNKLNSNFQDDNNNHKAEGDEELSKVLELSKKEFEESDLQKALKMSLIEHKKRQELSNIDKNGKGNQLEKEPFKININQDVFSQKLNEELNSKYVLCSVVIHTSYKNTAKFGHYFTYISENGKKWKSFNDSIVKDITKNHVFENKSTQKNCYLLCYINKSCIKK